MTALLTVDGPQDVDETAKILRDPTPKGKVAIEVPVSEEVLAAALRCVQRKYPRDRASQIDHRIEYTCEQLGLEKFTAHSIRVSYATHLGREGLPVYEIQRLLGHADIRTTLKYIRHSRKSVKGPI